MPNPGKADLSVGNWLQAKVQPSDSVHQQVGAWTTFCAFSWGKPYSKAALWEARFKQQHVPKGCFNCCSQHLLSNAALPMQTYAVLPRTLQALALPPRLYVLAEIKVSTQPSPNQSSRTEATWAVSLKVSLACKGMLTLNNMYVFPPLLFFGEISADRSSSSWRWRETVPDNIRSETVDGWSFPTGKYSQCTFAPCYLCTPCCLLCLHCYLRSDLALWVWQSHTLSHCRVLVQSRGWSSSGDNRLLDLQGFHTRNNWQTTACILCADWIYRFLQ